MTKKPDLSFFWGGGGIVHRGKTQDLCDHPHFICFLLRNEEMVI